MARTTTVKPRPDEFYELVEALAIVSYVYPFINAILRDKLKILVDVMPDLPTMGVTATELHINSAFFKSITPEQRIAAIAHELFHAMFMHPDRIAHYKEVGLDGRPVDPMALNYAADYIINDMIKAFKIGDLHKDWLWRADVSHEESLEDVYRRIIGPPRTAPPTNPGRSGEKSEPQQGEGQGGSGLGGAGDADEEDEAPVVGDSQDDESANDGSGYSIKNKRTGRMEAINAKGQFDTHVPDHDGPDELEWQTTVQAAMQVAKAIGKMPADMERFIEGFLAIEKNWKEEFADEIKAKAGFDTRNMQRPNRRKLYQDRIYIPTRHSWQIEKIAMIFDVSGSIGDNEIALFMGTAYDIFSQCKVNEFRCMCVNTRVIEDVTFNSVEELVEWKPHGSGGTDMEEGIRHLQEDGWDPDFCIILTDGYTTTDENNKPEFPVVWVTTGEENMAYGKVIKMDMNEAESIA